MGRPRIQGLELAPRGPSPSSIGMGSLADDATMLANNRAPAHSLHSAFTTAGALHYLVVQDAEDRLHLPKGRVQIVNVEHPLKIVQRDPLGVCDRESLDWRQDCIVNRLVLPTGSNKLGKYSFNPRQKWYYLGGQRPREADQGGMTLPDTAFVGPDSKSNPARERASRSRCLPFSRPTC